MKKARDVALKTLMRVELGNAHAAAVLNTLLQNNLDTREKSLATQIVYGVLKTQSWLDYLLDKVSSKGLKKLNPTVRQILRIGCYQIVFLDRIPARAAVGEAVLQVKNNKLEKFKGLVNALLRNISRMDMKDQKPVISDSASLEDLAIKLGVKEDFLKLLADSQGRKKAIAILDAFLKPSRNSFRINKVMSKNTSLPGDLSSLSSYCLDIDPPGQAASFVEDGLLGNQDEGAFLAALASEPKEGDIILDACAGRGGKTAALAILSQNKADITACDISENKLARLSYEMERQNLCAKTVCLDLTNASSKKLGIFDIVLIDAPCSGSGTIGRKPDLRWKFDAKIVKKLADIQYLLLKNLSSFVKPGGKLVFVTCSVFDDEGKNHYTRFLKEHPGFSPCKNAPLDWPDNIAWDNGSIFIDPSLTYTDGYQILCFKRIA